MKRAWVGVFLLLIILLSPSAYGIERGLLKALGLQELSGNREAPDFAVVGSDGKKISLKDYKGKVVILHFWATWCKPCKEEFPAFEKLYQRLKGKDVALVAISIDAKAGKDEVSAFARGLGATFPVFLAREGNVTNRYWTWGVPVTYFIDKKGWIIGRALGPRDWASPEMMGLIEGLLKE